MEGIGEDANVSLQSSEEESLGIQQRGAEEERLEPGELTGNGVQKNNP